MNPFDTILINPILNLLVAIYKVLEAANIPGSLGFAIILLTIIIKLILWPLTSAQLKSTKKMAELKPHLDRVKKEHGEDKLRHQQEVSKLYKEHGVNPLSGCLPLVMQIPVFIALYQVLLKIVDLNRADFLTSINSHIYTPVLHFDKVPSTHFLGFQLFDKPNQWGQLGFAILLVPIVTGVLQYVQSKMLVGSKTAVVKVKKDGKEGKESMEDTMASMQSQMTLIMPAMIAFFAYGFPVGLSLYWNTFTILGIIQQYKILGAGSLNKFLPEKWQK